MRFWFGWSGAYSRFVDSTGALHRPLAIVRSLRKRKPSECFDFRIPMSHAHARKVGKLHSEYSLDNYFSSGPQEVQACCWANYNRSAYLLHDVGDGTVDQTVSSLSLCYFVVELLSHCCRQFACGRFIYFLQLGKYYEFDIGRRDTIEVIFSCYSQSHVIQFTPTLAVCC